MVFSIELKIKCNNLCNFHTQVSSLSIMHKNLYKANKTLRTNKTNLILVYCNSFIEINSIKTS